MCLLKPNVASSLVEGTHSTPSQREVRPALRGHREAGTQAKAEMISHPLSSSPDSGGTGNKDETPPGVLSFVQALPTHWRWTLALLKVAIQDPGPGGWDHFASPWLGIWGSLRFPQCVLSASREQNQDVIRVTRSQQPSSRPTFSIWDFIT